ncbi:hypothetical protein P7K49_000021, partial [Saguinus oedipus]
TGSGPVTSRRNPSSPALQDRQWARHLQTQPLESCPPGQAVGPSPPDATPRVLPSRTGSGPVTSRRNPSSPALQDRQWARHLQRQPLLFSKVGNLSNTGPQHLGPNDP